MFVSLVNNCKLTEKLQKWYKEHCILSPESSIANILPYLFYRFSSLSAFVSSSVSYIYTRERLYIHEYFILAYVTYSI